MYQIIGIMAGILLMGYAFFRLGKLGKFYSETFSWNISRNIKLPLRFSLAVIAGIFCIDIWSVTAMVTLHLAFLFFQTFTTGYRGIIPARTRRCRACSRFPSQRSVRHGFHAQ